MVVLLLAKTAFRTHLPAAAVASAKPTTKATAARLRIFFNIACRMRGKIALVTVLLYCLLVPVAKTALLPLLSLSLAMYKPALKLCCLTQSRFEQAQSTRLAFRSVTVTASHFSMPNLTPVTLPWVARQVKPAKVPVNE